MLACFKAICFVCGGVSEGVVYIAMDDCIYVLYYFFCIEGLMSTVFFFYTRDHVFIHTGFMKKPLCTIRSFFTSICAYLKS